ncbi:lasso peptide biosynthesis B2 protein [Pseudanabaena sp. PCC 6802]|uniref:lasso peptide biosynthesis B2 protein n=1 Tax=Pseudanabaena sp. PCC 6802 TaxID=118173 RepID=UPI000361E64F|nr:lasso peptide biosynthesis B2 protein [Pseudanabaena sp. PCC 6802]
MSHFGALFSKAGKFIRLSWQEKSLLLQALVLLPLVAFCIHLLGMGRTQYALLKLCPQATSRSPESLWLQVETTARMVAIAAHYSQYWANCLKRSLVLWYLLRRQGIVSDLRIGVQQIAGEVQAHAWVEYQNKVLNDRPNIRQHFVPFERPIEVKLPAMFMK